ncbi:unnamed protein product [Albugo candida]|uniref:Uncharacterized protein n=1 Tax=Albugo candida TaxID=65357 RepID=A0A024GNI7_9STRA|nr:unnamed protein product [Albugo candida]|eukprot:CCI48101.1 unnamed protein product [Albugo candida]
MSHSKVHHNKRKQQHRLCVVSIFSLIVMESERFAAVEINGCQPQSPIFIQILDSAYCARVPHLHPPRKSTLVLPFSLKKGFALTQCHFKVRKEMKQLGKVQYYKFAIS